MSKKTQAVVAALVVLFSAMWNPWVSVVIALAALAWFVYLNWSEGKNKTYVPELHARKQENLERVMILAQEQEWVTNDDVERMLNISDATAERYLNELEKAGKLIQEGEGRATRYRLT